jgi:hypothetical protein
MIQDPSATRVHFMLGTGPTSEIVNLDKIGTGESSSTWRGNSVTTPGLRLDATVSHDVTKAGRRRSMHRVDVSYVDSSVSPAVTYKASAYEVVDQVDVPSAKDIIARNAALSALLNLQVGSKTAGADVSPTNIVQDWLNGEP